MTNVTAFGCFVDVGVHQDGLVHISELSDGFVANPADVVKPQDIVTVRAISVDEVRGRIGFSMKSGKSAKANQSAKADKAATNRQIISPKQIANLLAKTNQVYRQTCQNDGSLVRCYSRQDWVNNCSSDSAKPIKRDCLMGFCLIIG